MNYIARSNISIIGSIGSSNSCSSGGSSSGGCGNGRSNIGGSSNSSTSSSSSNSSSSGSQAPREGGCSQCAAAGPMTIYGAHEYKSSKFKLAIMHEFFIVALNGEGNMILWHT